MAKKVHINIRISEGHEADNKHEKFFMDIVEYVKEKIVEGNEDKTLRLNEVHPKTLIAILITNILVNLFLAAAHSKSMDVRETMLADLLEEVEFLTMQSFKQMKRYEADNDA